MATLVGKSAEETAAGLHNRVVVLGYTGERWPAAMCRVREGAAAGPGAGRGGGCGAVTDG
jgi:hypothetical protein